MSSKIDPPPLPSQRMLVTRLVVFSCDFIPVPCRQMFPGFPLFYRARVSNIILHWNCSLEINWHHAVWIFFFIPMYLYLNRSTIFASLRVFFHVNVFLPVLSVYFSPDGIICREYNRGQILCQKVLLWQEITKRRQKFDGSILLRSKYLQWDAFTKIKKISEFLCIK